MTEGSCGGINATGGSFEGSGGVAGGGGILISLFREDKSFIRSFNLDSISRSDGSVPGTFSGLVKVTEGEA